ncbi:WD40/YVTN/BNR-like repeat-containing protein [Zestomonas carbonaria]|uniref:Ycf48-like protein n=1 Tax=Zestomonas carbonaria TaxID=2762745 RepID=A0A7U7EQT2_9GAMM|nr:YCF48-related protein [Pseudomonas carbonaria]CAD5109381.1 Ycf48-like protein [Pseudomonas carbonaria]
MTRFGKPTHALLWAAFIMVAGFRAEASASAGEPLKVDRIILLDIQRAGSQLFSAGEHGWILRSDNDGADWEAVRTPADRTLTGLAFGDDQVGVAVGHGATLLRTADGGATWTAIPLDGIGRDALLGVTYLGDRRFVAYGSFGHYLESLDGGLSWTRRQILNEDFDRHIAKVLRAGDHLFLFGESGTLLRSADLGASWEQLESPYEGSFFGGLATPGGTLLAFGMRGSLYRSTDAGASWVPVPLDTRVALQGGQVLPDGRIVLVGNAGMLAISGDDGRSFVLGKAARGSLAQVAAVMEGVLAVGDSGIQALSLTSAAAN